MTQDIDANLDAARDLQHGPAYLDMRGVTKGFRDVTVIEGLDLQVQRGEFVSLLGPSGCGKTTLLRLIAGLLKPDVGRIVLDGENLTRLPAHKRRVGVVFQNYALFPHLNVADNVAFGLRAQGLPEAQVRTAVEQALTLVHLADLAQRSSLALSGGQAQRVAVARALAVRPRLLLLDEPFSALDRKLRETMQIELRRLLRELGITAVFVTHDQEEALVMSDRIAVMNQGAIEQFATPTTIYMQPATPFVLDFVGLATRLQGKVSAVAHDGVMVETPAGVVRACGNFAVGTSVLVAVRPEKLTLSPAATDQHANALTFTLRDRIFLGSKLLLHFDAADGDRAVAEVLPLSGRGAHTGATRRLALRRERHLDLCRVRRFTLGLESAWPH